MLYEPLLAHQMAKERMQDILLEAKQAQLTRIAEGSRRSARWRLPIASALSSLLALFVQP